MDALTAGRADTERSDASWRGAVTVAEAPALRDSLYRLLDTFGGTSLRLDVSAVTSIDKAGIALLVGVNRRAAAAGRTFILLDSAGAVSYALSRMHVLHTFLVTEVVPAIIDLHGVERSWEKAGRSEGR